MVLAILSAKNVTKKKQTDKNTAQPCDCYLEQLVQHKKRIDDNDQR